MECMKHIVGQTDFCKIWTEDVESVAAWFISWGIIVNNVTSAVLHIWF